MKLSSEKGFSLAETVVALGVLTTGVLGAAAVLAAGMQNLSSSPSDVIVTQKAAETIEAVFAARDGDKLPWSKIRNVKGASTNDGGIFLDDPQPLKIPGYDGLVNTADDGGTEVGVGGSTIESMRLPGIDKSLHTADDVVVYLSQYTREVKIRDVDGSNGQLRSITVTVTYQSGPTKRTYTLSTFISAYS